MLRQGKDVETPMCAGEYFASVERCENNGTYPCICVEEDVSSKRAWFEEHDDKKYLSEVKYDVEGGKLIVTIDKFDDHSLWRNRRVLEMICDNQVLVVLIVNQDDRTLLEQTVKVLMPNAHCRVIPEPLCDRWNVYPAATIKALLRILAEKEERQYVVLLQKSYVPSFSGIQTVVQKYEAEFETEFGKGKRLLTRRINSMDYPWADDFDLGHDFVFGKCEDINAILWDKQNGKHSITNNP